MLALTLRNVITSSSQYDRDLSGLYKTSGYTPSMTADFSFQDVTSDGYQETKYTIAPANDKVIFQIVQSPTTILLQNVLFYQTIVVHKEFYFKVSIVS